MNFTSANHSRDKLTKEEVSFLSLSLSRVQALFPRHNYFSIPWSRGQLRKNLNIPMSTPLF